MIKWVVKLSDQRYLKVGRNPVGCSDAATGFASPDGALAAKLTAGGEVTLILGSTELACAQCASCGCWMVGDAPGELCKPCQPVGSDAHRCLNGCDQTNLTGQLVEVSS